MKRAEQRERDKAACQEECSRAADLLGEGVDGSNVVVVEASVLRQPVQRVHPEPRPHDALDEVAAHTPGGATMRHEGRQLNALA